MRTEFQSYKFKYNYKFLQFSKFFLNSDNNLPIKFANRAKYSIQIRIESNVAQNKGAPRSAPTNQPISFQQTIIKYSLISFAHNTTPSLETPLHCYLTYYQHISTSYEKHLNNIYNKSVYILIYSYKISRITASQITNAVSVLL